MMKLRSKKNLGSAAGRRARRLAALAAAALGALPAAACDDTTVHTIDPNSSNLHIERFTQGFIDKIDILLDIDNSRSMADKQQILAEAVPDLVRGLVNPPCVGADGAPAASQPAGPFDACPTPGTERRIKPVTDIHIGVVSSSLGGHGADSCPDQEMVTCPSGMNLSNNDKGHLLSRKDPCDGSSVPTYANKGFLAWDPGQEQKPPGEVDLDTDTNGDGRALSPDLRDMVLGVGQIGCGYEAQLESWYRFLADPEPYASISVVNNKATPEGTDDVLLKQRADFLRPNSLLAILMLSDENDCSIKEYSQFFFAAQLKNGNGTQFHLPRARSECETNPNDPCCKSCGQGADNCPADPTCLDGNGNPKALTELEDPSNLRCFDQKRRFGIDFLYSVDRYTQALTSPSVPNRAGDLVPNPIFSDLNLTDDISNVRDSGLVFLAAIVGVPWQDIARDKDDLKKGFMNADEMLVKGASGFSAWDIVLGDPLNLVAPKDPHMIESIDPRSGTNPVTGGAIELPNVAPALPDPISGHEYTPTMARDDLQYACIFPLPEPRDCSVADEISCDCKDPANDNPLCDEDPKKPGSYTMQARAKAYPGLRELAVIRSISSQGIAASVCPAQLTDSKATDYGYRPAIEGIIDRLASVPDGQCLPTRLDVDETGQASCVFMESRKVDDASVAECNACQDPGRQPVSSDHKGMIDLAKKDPAYPSALWNCFCELKQASGADLDACQNDPSDPPVNKGTGQVVDGWCYVDASLSPPLGNPKIVENCPETQKRNVRFTGQGAIKNGASVFVACF